MNEDKAMKAYKALRVMESAADLKRAGFTLSDYYEAQEVLKSYVRNNGEEGTSTLNKAVADWYKRQGFKVSEQGENGVGWNIR